ncbi:MAG TPA: dephospho-CoA kinase [Gemmatimonadales bacterium]
MKAAADMLRVGLTGNVAAGKSTVSSWFAAWGATLIDADVLVREVQAPGSPVLEAIVRSFGPKVLTSDGRLDRAALRRRVMGDGVARATLNAIVHPAVQARRALRESEAAGRGDCVVVHDIALLFEALDPVDFDVIVVVDAPETVRHERLVRHRDLGADEARSLLRAQQPSADKRAAADLVIDNAGTLAQLETQAHGAWAALRRAGASKAAGTPPPAVAAVLTADGWTAATAGILARAHDAGGPTSLFTVGSFAPVTGIPPFLTPATADPGHLAAALGLAERAIVLTESQGSVAYRAATVSAGTAIALAWETGLDDPRCAARIDVRPWVDPEQMRGRHSGASGYVSLGATTTTERPVHDIADLARRPG